MSVYKDAMGKVASEKDMARLEPVAQSQHLTVASVRKHLPKGTSVEVTEEIVDMLNNAERDSGVGQEHFEEQLLGHMHLAKKGGIKALSRAVKFVALTIGQQVEQAHAYRIVFPDKAQKFDKEDRSIASAASEYSRSFMVKEIIKNQVLGFHISHAHLGGWGMAKAVNLANGIGAKPGDYVSPTVQLNAIQLIMDKVAPPEDQSLELKIGMSDEAKSATDNLAEKLGAMAEAQMANYKAGKSLGEVQKLNIAFTDTEVVDD